MTESTSFIDEAPPPRPVFDFCHAGVVMRALMGVLGMLALGSGLGARDFTDWLGNFTQGATVAVPAVLLWLMLVCAAQRVLVQWRPALLMAVLAALGAICALAPWLFVNAVLSNESGVPWFGGAFVALGGAVGAALLVQGLRMRARALGPSGMQARLVELQSRIRPHFLFNTLNTAVALVRLDPQRAERVLEDLAELFQAALAAPEGTSTLASEVALARRYLDIEQLRFGERLRVDWQLDAHAGRALVPPLLLQPLVENAVRYGVEPNADGGDVLVRTRRRGDRVELMVRNTLRASAPGGHGMALANVQERLRLLHDVAAQVTIENEPNRYTVRLLMPL